MIKTVFVGHFSPKVYSEDLASSAAGNQVQRRIFKSLADKTDTYCYSMTPTPSWPRAPLISKSLREGSIEFIGYINIPLVKHLIFSSRLFFKILHSKPTICFQYNSYFFENLFLLIYRAFHEQSNLVIFIQDIHIEKKIFKFSQLKLKRVLERLSLLSARSFNLIVPVSSAIISDFKFHPHKCFVFPGGVTEFAEQVMKCQREQLSDFAVFAGALEAYNGIDRLVDYWAFHEIQQTLHIFGRGSLQKYIEKISISSKNIVFHGHQSEEAIIQWQCAAKWNFCLRYSDGLKQEYFFPSKLFNILCAPGITIANDFHGLPLCLRNYIQIIPDNLSSLSVILQDNRMNKEYYNEIINRRNIILSNFSWSACVKKCIDTI